MDSISFSYRLGPSSFPGRFQRFKVSSHPPIPFPPFPPLGVVFPKSRDSFFQSRKPFHHRHLLNLYDPLSPHRTPRDLFSTFKLTNPQKCPPQCPPPSRRSPPTFLTYPLSQSHRLSPFFHPPFFLFSYMGLNWFFMFTYL